jgi:hypothetical protein
MMTNPATGQMPGDEPEADVAEQQRSVADTEDPTLDVGYIADRSDSEANPADVIEQAIEVPLPDDEHTTE